MRLLKIYPTFFLSLVLVCIYLPFAVAESGEAPDLEDNLKKQGLVDIQSLDKSILVELKYSTTDNFMKADAYGDLEKCYLRPEAAKMLAEAEKYLQKEHPGFSLLVLDCVRPRNIQRKMWAIVKGTDLQQYVADPDKGSIHNYGAAVDLTVCDESGKEIDMGTPFDFFGDLAQPRLEEKFLKEKKLTEEQIKNRMILRKAMKEAGFIPLEIEWWHFNAFPNNIINEKYSIIE
jgi:D-alanyl-D-alanine dipeptidase